MRQVVQDNWPGMALAALLGSGSGVGGTILYINVAPAQLQEIARPDPATGSELRQIERRIDYLESRVSVLEALDRRRSSP